MKTYILIDRSGSMSNGWHETVGAVTTFAKGVKGKLHVALFDAYGPMDYVVVHNGKAKNASIKATMSNYQPRGMTPLYDAVGKLDTYVRKDNTKKAQIVIVTDGYENSSRVTTQSDVKEIVKAWEASGFDVVYIGASFECAAHQAQAMGIKPTKTVNMSNRDTYVGTMSAMSTRNMAYASGTVGADDDLGDKVREAAK